MVLELDKALEMVKDSEPQAWVKLAREDSSILKTHFYGEGTAERLKQIQGLESKERFLARKRYAVSNSYVTDQLLRPADGIFSAKGGSEVFSGDKELVAKLKAEMKDVARGQTLDQYLKNEWWDRAITDPNGLVYQDIKDGSIELIYKSIYDINKMEVKGTKPEYIVFEPHKTLSEDKSKRVVNSSGIHTKAKAEKEFIWVVDDEKYMEFVRENGEVTLVQTLQNSLGRVPAVQNSPIYDTSRRIKLSPIWMQIELLDSYLIDNSIRNVYKKLMGFPITWRYASKCTHCNGTGRSGNSECSACHGTGNSTSTDVADVMLLNPPKTSDSPTVAGDLAGFHSPDLDTLGAQAEDLETTFELMFKSLWGTTERRGGDADRATATGRFIDVKPVDDKLYEFSEILRAVKSSIYEISARFVAPTSELSVSVSTGKRFMTESPDELLKSYTQAKSEGVDDITLDYMLTQYIEAEFQSDDDRREYHLKVLELDPFPHMSAKELMDMQLPFEVWSIKLAFRNWVNSTEMVDFLTENTQKLRASLKDFANSTIPKPTTPEESPL